MGKRSSLLPKELKSEINSAYKFAFIGTHGVGKTTAVHEVGKTLQEDPGLLEYKVNSVTEVAARCPFPINEHTTTTAQLWIFAAQLENEILSRAPFTITLCDRSILDNLVYSIYSEKYAAVDGIMPFVKEWLYTYDAVFHILPVYPIQPAPHRSMDPTFQHGIFMKLLEYIARYRLPVYEGSRDHVIKMAPVVISEIIAKNS